MAFQLDALDMHDDDGYFCGWDTSEHNADSLRFQPQHLVKIVKPQHLIKPTTDAKVAPSPLFDHHTSPSKHKRASVHAHHHGHPNKLDPLAERRKKAHRHRKSTHGHAKASDHHHRRVHRKKKHKRKLAKIPLTRLVEFGFESKYAKHQRLEPQLAPTQIPAPASPHAYANPNARFKLHTVSTPQSSPPKASKKKMYDVELILQNASNRQNKAIREFLSRRKQGKLKHIGALPSPKRINAGAKDKLGAHSGPASPRCRELVPIVTKMDNGRVATRSHTHGQSKSQPGPQRRKAEPRPRVHRSNSKHANAKRALSHHLARQESAEMHKEISKIMAQRSFYMSHLRAIFDSLEQYLVKLDGVLIAKSGQQVETVLGRFDKNIVYHLKDLRKVTWNLVFFLKAIHSRSKSNLRKFANPGAQHHQKRGGPHSHSSDALQHPYYSSYHEVITALLEDGDFVGKSVHVMAYLRLPNTMCNPFLLPRVVLDPLNRCASSKRLSAAIDGLKAVDLKHDLNRSYKLNEMDKHRYLSAHQWLLQLYQTSVAMSQNENKDVANFEKKLKQQRRGRYGRRQPKEPARQRTVFPKLKKSQRCC